MLSRVATKTVKYATRMSSRWQPTPMAAAASSFSTELVPGKGFGKTSTGIVGLPVDLDACSNIVTKYQALLDRMAASDLPETAQYRVDVEKIAKYRIQIATEYADDPDMVEELCRCGQVEELVQQADDEMMVLDMYLKERLWEEIDYDVDVEIEYNPDPSKDADGLDDDEEAAAAK